MKNNIEELQTSANTDTEFLAKERAQRARLVRNMTGMTRVTCSRRYGISSSNFQNWEGPRYGGLTEKAARKLVSIYAKEGVEVTVEWLMYGSGIPPTIIMSKPRYKQLEVKGHEEVYVVAPTSEREQMPQEKRSIELAKIAQELELFKQNYDHEVLVTVVTDKAMDPLYKIGDYVAGKRHSNISAFFQSECVVELADKKLLVRILQPGNEKGRYNLVNSNTEIRPIIMRDVQILSVAPVMWIRRMEKE